MPPWELEIYCGMPRSVLETWIVIDWLSSAWVLDTTIDDDIASDALNGMPPEKIETEIEGKTEIDDDTLLRMESDNCLDGDCVGWTVVDIVSDALNWILPEEIETAIDGNGKIDCDTLVSMMESDNGVDINKDGDSESSTRDSVTGVNWLGWTLDELTWDSKIETNVDFGAVWLDFISTSETAVEIDSSASVLLWAIVAEGCVNSDCPATLVWTTVLTTVEIDNIAIDCPW